MVSRIGMFSRGARSGTVGLALAPWRRSDASQGDRLLGMRPDYLAVRPSSLAWTTDVPNGAGSLNGTAQQHQWSDSKISGTAGQRVARPVAATCGCRI